MDWIGIVGAAGTFGFGILSLYQWTALKALRRAIRAHAQSAYNLYWNIGGDTGFVSNAVKDNPQLLNTHMIMGRCRAADAASIAGRHDVINFAREYAGFVPFPEKAWEPQQRLLQEKGWIKKMIGALGGE